MFNIRKPLVALALLLLAAGAPTFAAGHAAPPSPVDAPMQWIASMWQDILDLTGFVDPEPAEAGRSSDPLAVRSASEGQGGVYGESIEPGGDQGTSSDRDTNLVEAESTTSEYGESIEPNG